MANWDASTYDRFEAERARPSRDLIARLAGMKPRRIVDLGCGSGLSTLELKRTFKKAEILGVDVSPDMLKAAATRLPHSRSSRVQSSRSREHSIKTIPSCVFARAIARASSKAVPALSRVDPARISGPVCRAIVTSATLGV